MKSQPGPRILTWALSNRNEGVKESQHAVMNAREQELLKACQELDTSIFLPQHLRVAIEEDGVR